MRQFFQSLPARVAGFLLPSERRIANRQRLLMRAGLEITAAREAVRWITASRFDWIARRRERIMCEALSCT